MKRFCKYVGWVLLTTLVIAGGAVLFAYYPVQPLYKEIFLGAFFSDKKYAEQIEVQAYIVKSEQIEEIFQDINQEPVQLTKKDLERKECYLLLRLKNKGDRHAWGTLAGRVPSFHHPMPVTIPGLDPDGQVQLYLTFIGASASFLRTDTPELSFTWERLYTKSAGSKGAS